MDLVYRLPELADLWFVDTQVTSQGLARLGGHKTLVELGITSTREFLANHQKLVISGEAIEALATKLPPRVVIAPPTVIPPPPVLSEFAVRLTASGSPVEVMLPVGAMTMSLCAWSVREVVPMMGPPGWLEADFTIGALMAMRLVRRRS